MAFKTSEYETDQYRDGTWTNVQPQDSAYVRDVLQRMAQRTGRKQADDSVRRLFNENMGYVLTDDQLAANSSMPQTSSELASRAERLAREQYAPQIAGARFEETIARLARKTGFMDPGRTREYQS
jgi:hypothetical protein